MDIDFAHQQSQRVLKQRNLFAVTSCGLFLALCGMLLVAANRRQEIILVPAVKGPMTLTATSVSPEYLEAVTRDVATVALNRSPENLDYWMQSLLNLTDESSRGQLKVDLLKVYQEQSGTQITQFFTPDGMQVYPDRLQSQVSGIVHTVAANKEVSTQHRLFRFVWAYNGFNLKLKGFGAVMPKEPGQKADWASSAGASQP
jgi:conjugal transfer pilus assembly protein TraE